MDPRPLLYPGILLCLLCLITGGVIAIYLMIEILRDSQKVRAKVTPILILVLASVGLVGLLLGLVLHRGVHGGVHSGVPKLLLAPAIVLTIMLIVGSVATLIMGTDKDHLDNTSAITIGVLGGLLILNTMAVMFALRPLPAATPPPDDPLPAATPPPDDPLPADVSPSPIPISARRHIREQYIQKLGIPDTHRITT
jgi:hypothetical protein